MSSSSAAEFDRAIGAGGVVLFPSDTVYGLACDPENEVAIARLYALKGRPSEKSAAVMFFGIEPLLRALPELGQRTGAALVRLLPGAVTVLVPNPDRRFPLACQADPETLGVRAVDVPILRGAKVAVLQSSANRSGGPDCARVTDVPTEIRTAADLVLDGGVLPGVPSTVIDLREYEQDGRWSVLRFGAVGTEIADVLEGRFQFHPASYADLVSRELPDYDQLQSELVKASGVGARRILDLGTGTGETVLRLLSRHPAAAVVAVDESEQMLKVACERLGDRLERGHAAMLQDPLPPGGFDLVVSALAIHHLDAVEKAELFARIRPALVPGGRFVLADVVVPEDPADAVTELTPGYDKPSTVAEQLRWLAEAGLSATVRWTKHDLAVIVAEQTVPAGTLGADR